MRDEALDYTLALRSLMQRAEISSFKALRQGAGVSEWQVAQLRRGKAAQMRVEVLQRLSQVLRVSLIELLIQFAELANLEQGRQAEEKQEMQEQDLRESTAIRPPAPNSGGDREQNSPKLGNSGGKPVSPKEVDNRESEAAALRQEYQRLQLQFQQQRERLTQDFQEESLQILESWLLQFPTAAYAAQKNPQVPAVRLLPLMRPVEQLVQAWGLESIAPVGAEIPYDPQQHQLMDGTAQVGDRVRVRYTGYRQGNRLLYRAKVSPTVGNYEV